jgi:hypothetical protein
MSLVMKLCLWILSTNGPIVHPPDDIWAWENCGEMMMRAEENSLLVYQSDNFAL